MFAIIQAHKFSPQALMSTHPQGLQKTSIPRRPCSHKLQEETLLLKSVLTWGCIPYTGLWLRALTTKAVNSG